LESKKVMDEYNKVIRGMQRQLEAVSNPTG